MTNQAELLSSFSRARVSAMAHMAKADAIGLTWHEETVTDIVLVEAPPYVTVLPFNRREEGKVGADWLWWWVDDAGEAFGMLVQAKRLTIENGRWKFGFDANHGEQRERLMSAADRLRVPAAYVLYAGTPAYRAPVTCEVNPHTADCGSCQRRTLAVFPGILATPGGTGDDGLLAYQSSVALEDFADPSLHEEPVFDVHLAGLNRDLRDFLAQGQSGARHVARLLLQKVSEVRARQFSATTVELERSDLDDRVFSSLPKDTGHFGRPYFEAVLQGLRSSPPSYVQELTAGGGVDVQGVAGVIVVRC